MRLRDGVDKARAEAVLTAVARRIASQYPDTYKGKTVTLVNREDMGVLGTIILSLAGLVLLIACANIAGILMAQGEARRREFAVRAAMGASRGRLVRQLMAESLLLSLAAAGLGLLAALWLIRVIPGASAALGFLLRLRLSHGQQGACIRTGNNAYHGLGRRTCAFVAGLAARSGSHAEGRCPNRGRAFPVSWCTGDRADCDLSVPACRRWTFIPELPGSPADTARIRP